MPQDPLLEFRAWRRQRQGLPTWKLVEEAFRLGLAVGQTGPRKAELGIASGPQEPGRRRKLGTGSVFQSGGRWFAQIRRDGRKVTRSAESREHAEELAARLAAGEEIPSAPTGRPVSPR